MTRSCACFAFSTLVLVIATVPCLLAQKKQPLFSAPDINTAADVSYPIDSVAAGIVVVAVDLDGAGRIKQKVVLREIPSLTTTVLMTIETWTFKPATLEGKGVDSTVVVSIVFNPSDYRLGGAAIPVLGK